MICLHSLNCPGLIFSCFFQQLKSSPFFRSREPWVAVLSRLALVETYVATGSWTLSSSVAASSPLSDPAGTAADDGCEVRPLDGTHWAVECAGRVRGGSAPPCIHVVQPASNPGWRASCRRYTQSRCGEQFRVSTRYTTQATTSPDRSRSIGKAWRSCWWLSASSTSQCLLVC